MVQDLTATGMNQRILEKALSQNVTISNESKADIDAMKKTVEALCTKLDADAGITDTDYNALFKKGGSDTDALPAVIAAADLSLIGL